MDFDTIVSETNDFIRSKFEGEGTGHDYWHIKRVWQLSKKIAKEEAIVNMFIVEMGALLHDIADHKFHNGDELAGKRAAQEFLNQFDFDQNIKNAIVQIITEISFKGSNVPTPMSTLEGKIVQDADRLDAIGAIGIARTFAYGGSKNREMYNPNIKPVCHTSFAAYKNSTAPTINHFYEKLLLLKDLMNTDKAKEIAQERHEIMEEFLRNFYNEWFV